MPAITTVLIVDDKPHIRVPLQYLLATIPDLKILTAENGVQAVEAALKHKPELVMMDVMMPELDGYAACQRIRESWGSHNGEIWFLTARSSTADADQARQVGAQDVIHKPFDPDAVLGKVRAFLSRRAAAQAA